MERKQIPPSIPMCGLCNTRIDFFVIGSFYIQFPLCNTDYVIIALARVITKLARLLPSCSMCVWMMDSGLQTFGHVTEY